MRLHSFAILIIELITMAMALKDDGLAICLIGFRAGSKAADPVAQAHGSSLVRYLPLRHHQVNDRIRGLWIEFAAIGPRQPQNVAGELDDSNLQAQA